MDSHLLFGRERDREVTLPESIAVAAPRLLLSRAETFDPHAPILMGYPEATIYQFDEEGIRPVGYTDTEHYVVTRAFLGDPARMLRELLD